MRVAHIVQVFFDVDSSVCTDRKWEPTADWVRERIELFKCLTVPSLMNQEFRDFRIWVLCGSKHRDITREELKLIPKIEVYYDLGRNALKIIEADYLAVTRLDSDDLFHKYAMREVLRAVRPVEKMESLIFRSYLVWDTNQHFIVRVRRHSPCFITQVFPKSLYKDWPSYAAKHFVWHEYAGGRDSRTRELPPDMACVVKHTNNFGNLKKGEDAALVEDAEELKRKHGLFEKKPARMREILRHYGVSAQEFERWQK